MMYDDNFDIPALPNANKNNRELRPAFYLKEPINGTVRNVNRRALTRMEHKAKIRKRRVVAGALVTTHLLAAIIGANIHDRFMSDAPQPSLPSGYILTEIENVVEPGDTITEIANEYYNSTYSSMYGSVENYTDAILEQNGLKPHTTIQPGQSVSIPVVINSDNEIYIRIQALKDAIHKITEENLWVSYTVGNNDSYSSLAAKASGSVSETYTIMHTIMEKNKNARFWPGDTVMIMNPELGPLKVELVELEDQLQETLKVNQSLEEQKTH